MCVYPKEFGGLGVRSIKEFKMTLLGKWCQRELVENDSLWVKVLAYGTEVGRLDAGGRLGSAWWKQLKAVRHGVGWWWVLSFWWMKARKSSFDYDINNWWGNPTMLMG